MRVTQTCNSGNNDAGEWVTQMLSDVCFHSLTGISSSSLPRPNRRRLGAALVLMFCMSSVHVRWLGWTEGLSNHSFSFYDPSLCDMVRRDNSGVRDDTIEVLNQVESLRIIPVRRLRCSGVIKTLNEWCINIRERRAGRTVKPHGAVKRADSAEPCFIL